MAVAEKKMAVAEKKTEKAWGKIVDAGLDEGIKKLTPEKIEKVINKALAAMGGARLKTYVDTCIHCGLCSEACHHYLSNDRDPSFAPVAKVKQTMWPILKNKGRVTPEFIRRAAEIAYTECNLCKRCSMYCPFGIDMAYILLSVRRICHLLGVTPLYLQDTAHSHAVTMNQMWVKQDDWIDTVQWQEEEIRAEIKNPRIPIDKEGADIMYSVIGPEPKFQAQLMGQAAIIMNVAGINWTYPSFDGWDNSDMAMYSGDHEIMGRVKRAHFEAAFRLKAKKIVMGECGHAFRSIYDVGNRWLGLKMPPVPVIHAIQFYYELLREGRIKIAKKFKEPVTLHDPCNVIRGRGLGEMARYVTNAICEDFTEMQPNREYNFCCCAGGGVINCGPPWAKKRAISNRVKAEQMKETGAHIVITPCHNCHSGIEDIIKYYKLGMHTKFFSEILVEVMEIPEEFKVG
ncbi:MAG: (Fe-S)-binding protein [Thermodesulfovibrionales bacterium]|nr:(Fe-S)-binding protein [Thermodesulfovibrionales bacterium]